MNILKIKASNASDAFDVSDIEKHQMYSIYVICSYCKKVIDVKEDVLGSAGKISHGICDECLEKEIGKLKKLPDQNKQL